MSNVLMAEFPAMSDMLPIDELPIPENMPPLAPVEEVKKPTEELDEGRAQLLDRIVKRIKADKEHHKKSFDRMRRDQHIATYGCLPDSDMDLYVANISGRYVRMKTAGLYAKNPKITARRRASMDFANWDENPNSLMAALQVIQAAQQMSMMVPPPRDTGLVGPDGMPMMVPGEPPPPPPGFEEAMGLMADYEQGMKRRQDMSKLGRTLELVFAYAMTEQRPLPFKTSFKQVVRRACTNGVAYVKLAFQREYGPSPVVSDQLADYKARAEHLKRIAADLDEGEIDDVSAEAADLEASIATIEAAEEVVTREGLIFDYPLSTRVIPDKLCQKLQGFIGSRHLTVELLLTLDEVRALFPDANVERDFIPHGFDGMRLGGEAADGGGPNYVPDDDELGTAAKTEREGLVCVWEHFDKASGNVYYVAEGVKRFLREPAAPDVFVEGFWPVYALTYNDVENEKQLFPPSDVALMLPMQLEFNRSRQGMREHRKAARPRWISPVGAIPAEDKTKISNAEPFSITTVNVAQSVDIRTVLQAMPMPGVDPNLYETGPIFSDTQMVVGAQESSFGGLANATATESAISASATQSSDGSAIDELDAFLTLIARDGGIILMKEMSQEQVTRIAGPGAFWPDMTLSDIAAEIGLEVEAGSTGKPNQAVELNNWSQLLPFITQIPGIDPVWLLKEMLRRLDDKMDITEAISAGLPSIVAQNALATAQAGAAPPGQPGQAPGGDPASDPNAQGGAGAAGASGVAQPDGAQGGSGPAFGNNQV